MWLPSPRSVWTGEVIAGISFSVAFTALSLVPLVTDGVSAGRGEVPGCPGLFPCYLVGEMRIFSKIYREGEAQGDIAGVWHPEGHKKCSGIASLSVADRLSETRPGNLPLELSKVSWREGQEPNDSECKRTLENRSGVHSYR